MWPRTTQSRRARPRTFDARRGRSYAGRPAPPSPLEPRVRSLARMDLPTGPAVTAIHRRPHPDRPARCRPGGDALAAARRPGPAGGRRPGRWRRRGRPCWQRSSTCFRPPATCRAARLGRDLRLAAAGRPSSVGPSRPRPGRRPGRPARRHDPGRARTVRPPAGLHLGRAGPHRRPGHGDRLRPGDHDAGRRPRGRPRDARPPAGQPDRGRAVVPRAASSSSGGSTGSASGSSPPTTYGRPSATRTDTPSDSGLPSWRHGTRCATGSRTSGGGSCPSSRSGSASGPATWSTTWTIGASCSARSLATA